MQSGQTRQQNSSKRTPREDREKRAGKITHSCRRPDQARLSSSIIKRERVKDFAAALDSFKSLHFFALLRKQIESTVSSLLFLSSCRGLQEEEDSVGSVISVGTPKTRLELAQFVGSWCRADKRGGKTQNSMEKPFFFSMRNNWQSIARRFDNWPFVKRLLCFYPLRLKKRMNRHGCQSHSLKIGRQNSCDRVQRNEKRARHGLCAALVTQLLHRPFSPEKKKEENN